MIVEMDLKVVEMEIEMEVEPPSSCLSHVLGLTSLHNHWHTSRLAPILKKCSRK